MVFVMNIEELAEFDLRRRVNGNGSNKALLKQYENDPVIRLELAAEEYVSNIPRYDSQTGSEKIIENARLVYDITRVPDLSPKLLSMVEKNEGHVSGNRAVVMLLHQRTVDGLYRHLIDQIKAFGLKSGYDQAAWVELKKYTDVLGTELIGRVSEELEPIDGVLVHMQGILEKWHNDYKKYPAVNQILPELRHYIFTLNELERNKAIVDIIKDPDTIAVIGNMRVSDDAIVAGDLYHDELGFLEKDIEETVMSFYKSCGSSSNDGILEKLNDYQAIVLEN